MYALLAITATERAAGPVDAPPAAPPPTIRNLAVPSASVTTETRRRVQSTVIPGKVWDAASPRATPAQLPKSRITTAPATGLLATSLATTTTSPDRSTTPLVDPTRGMQWGAVLVAALGIFEDLAAAPLASARSASAGASAPPKRGNTNPPPGSPPEEGRASPWELPRGVGGCSRKGAQRRPVPGRRGGQPRGAGRPCPQRAAAVEQLGHGHEAVAAGAQLPDDRGQRPHRGALIGAVRQVHAVVQQDDGSGLRVPHRALGDRRARHGIPVPGRVVPGHGDERVALEQVHEPRGAQALGRPEEPRDASG